MKRVLFLTYYFPPASGAGSQRARKLVKYLPRAGWTPVVAAGHDPFLPEDQSLLEDVKDAEVMRVRPGLLPRALLGSRVPRLALNRLLVPDVQAAWLASLRRATDALLSSSRIDLVFTSCGPFSLNAEGARLKRRRRVPWVTDFRDAWTLGAAFRPLTPLHGWLERRMEARACDECDHFIANTPAFLAEQKKKFPVIASKSSCLPNGYDPADFPDEAPSGLPPGDRPWKLTYAGSWYRRLYPDDLFRVLADFRQERGAPLEVHYAGPHSRPFGERVRALGLGDCLKDHGSLGYRESLRLIQESDLLLLTLPRDGRAGYWVPAKLYEYLASGKPVLALCPPGDVPSLVQGQGRVVTASGAEALSRGRQALSELWDAWRGGRTVERSPALAGHEYPALAARLAGIFDRVVRG